MGCFVKLTITGREDEQLLWTIEDPEKIHRLMRDFARGREYDSGGAFVLGGRALGRLEQAVVGFTDFGSVCGLIRPMPNTVDIHGSKDPVVHVQLTEKGKVQVWRADPFIKPPKTDFERGVSAALDAVRAYCESEIEENKGRFGTSACGGPLVAWVNLKSVLECLDPTTDRAKAAAQDNRFASITRHWPYRTGVPIGGIVDDIEDVF